MAREFLAWLEPAPAAHWLEIGCGSGAFTSSICALCEPASVVACDSSEPFVEHAKAEVSDPRASFVVAAAPAIPERTGGFDVLVSGLVLNFIPDPLTALTAMRDRVRSGGVVAAYLWDYAGGLEFLQCFWARAVAADPDAASLDEARRFEAWQPSHVRSLFEGAGLASVENAALSITTTFASFDDYWQPFLGGTGPAPSYVASLDTARRDALAEQLRATLPTAANGSISLRARAWAVRGLRR